MERYLNTITMLLSIFGGIVVRLLGGLDQLLDVFLFLIIVDFITGWIKAIATKNCQSDWYARNCEKSDDVICGCRSGSC